MKKYTGLIALLLLASTTISCGIVGNLMRHSPQSSAPVNTAANSSVNTEPAKPKFQALKDKAAELGQLSPPVKLDPKAKIRGKVAIVEHTTYNTNEMIGINADGTDTIDYDLDHYGIKKEQLAVKTDELDTLIQINCKQGAAIGQYNVSDGRVIPAYAINCQLSIIDYKTPVIIAQKKIVSRELAKDIKVYDTTQDVTANMPYEAIEKYIKKLLHE